MHPHTLARYQTWDSIRVGRKRASTSPSPATTALVFLVAAYNRSVPTEHSSSGRAHGSIIAQ
eukprot:2357546-Rhodomonas_salina.5